MVTYIFIALILFFIGLPMLFRLFEKLADIYLDWKYPPDDTRLVELSGTSPLPKRPWVAAKQHGMQFILSKDNEILWRVDWIPWEILTDMVDAANKTAIAPRLDELPHFKPD